jgi:hypothetical protein
MWQEEIMGYLLCAANRDICLAGLEKTKSNLCEDNLLRAEIWTRDFSDSKQKCDKLDFYAEYKPNGFWSPITVYTFIKSVCAYKDTLHNVCVRL